MRLVTSDEMRAFDKKAIEFYGIPGVVLMENAGKATFELLMELVPTICRGAPISVIAGPGSNGGDGYVIARHLQNAGASVRTYLAFPKEKIKGDALINLKILEQMNGGVYELRNEEDLAQAKDFILSAHAVVDAMFGTGLKSGIRDLPARIIELINQSDFLKMAVDIPSGIDSDTGRILGVAVKANVTATFGFVKLGMALYPGRSCCGEIHRMDISIPAVEGDREASKASWRIDPDLSKYSEARKDPEAYKGDYGNVVVIGGSSGLTGAPTMSALAASNVGAGLVTIAVPASINNLVAPRILEQMTYLCEDKGSGYFHPECADNLLQFLDDKNVVILGPGCTTTQSAVDFIKKIIKQYNGILVLDADGLNAVANDTSILKDSSAQIIVTPHPGEMGRLTNLSSKEVQENRIETARSFAAEHGVVVALKGAATITAFKDGKIVINSTGNPWMSSGGQGDALSGIIGGLCAQKIEIEEAVPMAVWLHGYTADRIVRETGPAPVLAGDLIQGLKQTISELLQSSS